MHENDPKAQDLEDTMYEYKSAVYGLAVTMLTNRHDADDVFQEVFLLYFIKQPRFDDAAAKRSWLIKTTVNKCRQYNNSKWSKHIDSSAEPDDIPFIEAAEDKALYYAVRELPYKYREAVYLHYFLGIPVNRAAVMVGAKANTFSMRLSKAMKLLRNRLE